MSSLLHDLGLSEQISFHDVFSIDEPAMLDFVPRPALALLLVFPTNDTYEKFRIEEDTGRNEYEGSGADEEVMWYKQTIGNACGLIGLLHAASNGPAKDFIGMSSPPSLSSYLINPQSQAQISPTSSKKPFHSSL